MVVGGAPEETDDHAERVANFAIDMVLAAGQVKDPADKSKTIKVSIRQSLNTVTPCICTVRCNALWHDATRDAAPAQCRPPMSMQHKSTCHGN